MHVRTGVLDAGGNVMNDEAKVMRSGSESDVIKRAIGVVAGDEDGTAVEAGSVFRGVADSVDGPGSVVGVGAEIVDARLIYGNRRVRLEFGRRLDEVDNGAAGEYPCLEILCELQVHVRARILDVAVVNDKTEQAIELRGIDSDIEIGAIRVVTGDEVVGVAKVAVRIGGGEKWEEVPVRVIIVGTVIMNARFARGNRGIALLDGGRQSGFEKVAAGELPVFVALCC